MVFLEMSVDQYSLLWESYGISDVPKHLLAALHSQSQDQQSQDVVPRPTLESIARVLDNCQRCKLAAGRNKIVLGDGNPNAQLMFVGEGPGADEDASGLPFVGRAGKLLTKIIEAMGLERKDVFIANVVKCRPPGNRTPESDEIESCTPFLKMQIDAIQPRIIVALGLPSAVYLTGKSLTMGALRSNFHPLAWNPKVAIMPTYHPAYLLRNPPAKKFVWDDMKLVMDRLTLRKTT